MAKPRLAINKGLPARWSIRRGAFYFSVPPGLEPSWDGKQLFRLGATLAEAHAEFGRRLGETAVPAGKTLGDLIARYLREETPKKAPDSQKNDAYAAGMLEAVFGEVPLKAPFPVTWAYQHVDSRRNPKTGTPSPVQGRKEIKLLSAMFTAAARWGWIERNPLVGQLRFEDNSEPGTYVDDDLFILALEKAPPWLQVYLWLKLATGLRQKDMLALRVSDINGATLKVTPSKTRRKTGKTLLFELDPFTAGEVARLASERSDASLPLFRTSRSNPYNRSSFDSVWRCMMRKVVQAGGQRFTEHDIRGKTGSDATTVESASRRLGHATVAVTRKHYRRAPERIRPGE